MKTLTLSNFAFVCLGICCLLCLSGLVAAPLFRVGQLSLFVWLGVVGWEAARLFRHKSPLAATRRLPARLSNGDANEVSLRFTNQTEQGFYLIVREELPDLLQQRTWQRVAYLPPGNHTTLAYEVQPQERGEYTWGYTQVQIRRSRWGLVGRWVTLAAPQSVAAYPSFKQFRERRLNAVANDTEQNDKWVRKLGQSLEFEQIKEYAPGDDHRHINWKASAKRGLLMVNEYQAERSQDIYCAIDLGRTMQQPFYGQTLLDHSIDASLAVAKSALAMQDRVGLLNFSIKGIDFLPARREVAQFSKLNERLYDVTTDFLESDFELLYNFTRQRLKQRSLLIIFSNFDTVNALHRQLPYLRAMARYHLLLVVFFENTEIAAHVQERAVNAKEVYEKTIGRHLLLQTRQVVKELEKHSILSVATTPENLSIDTLNAYLQIKKRQLL